MSQQQLGAVALVALGILVAVGAGSAAWRLRRRQRSREPLWSRLLATLATVGLVVGFVTTGVYYYYAPPLPQLLWLAQVATAAFALAVIGYVATITPALWRKVWGS